MTQIVLGELVKGRGDIWLSPPSQYSHGAEACGAAQQIVTLQDVTSWQCDRVDGRNCEGLLLSSLVLRDSRAKKPEILEWKADYPVGSIALAKM